MSDAALVFGASGALGSAIVRRLRQDSVTVIDVSRRSSKGSASISSSVTNWARAIPPQTITRAIWAQGSNAEGSVLDSSVEQLREMFEANVVYVVETLRALLDARALAPTARLVIVSSVWQETARSRKLAYTTSKAAVAGLVRSLVADLGALGHEVNAVLPGVVDTPMTRKFLSMAQIARIERETPTGRLVTPEHVAAACAWLSDAASAGINGQFVTVDGGWSGVRGV
jgi:3-oxoacyl-[acyl-carrier protein] reductase